MLCRGVMRRDITAPIGYKWCICVHMGLAVPEKLTDKRVKSIPLPSRAEAQREVWDSVLPGFGLRLGWKGRRSFMVQCRIHGHQRRFTVGTYPAIGLAEARERARAIMEDAQRGIDPKRRQELERQANEARARDRFRDVAEAFIAERVEGRLRTARPYAVSIRRDLYPVWGNRSIHDIRRRDVKELLSHKAKTAPIEANRLLEKVRRLFNWCVDEEILEANPASRITPPALETERERVLTDAEFLLFWRATERLGDPFGSYFQTLAVTAQRVSEVAHMRWADLQLEAGRAYGVKGGAWSLPGESAKEGSGHLVPLPALACCILSGVPQIGPYVFMSGRTKNTPISGFSKGKARLDRAMADLAREDAAAAGADPDTVELRPWWLHDLRRTAATRMRGLGVDRLTVSKVLNHAEAGVTRVYDRFSMDTDKRRALERWADYIERLEGFQDVANRSSEPDPWKAASPLRLTSQS